MPDDNKFLLGQIIDEPAAQTSEGPTLTFFPTIFLPQPHLKQAALSNWDFFDGALLALHFYSADGQSILGSAVLVAPGIALCARHVVEPFVDGIRARTTELICSAISKSGVMFWRVTEIVITRQTDIAILGLRFASRMSKGNEFTLAALTTRLPRLGETMTIAGFVASKQRFESVLDSANSVGGNVCVATGIVSQRFELQRDRFLLPWPTVEIDCANLGGMSGGPAFDEQGRLVGIVCSGVQSSEQTGPTYISLLWPVLATKVQPDWPVGYYGNPISMLEIDDAVCRIDRREAVSIEHDHATGLPMISYKKW